MIRNEGAEMKELKGLMRDREVQKTGLEKCDGKKRRLDREDNDK